MRRTLLATAELRIEALEEALRREHYGIKPSPPYPTLGSFTARKKHVESCVTCMLLGPEEEEPA